MASCATIPPPMQEGAGSASKLPFGNTGAQPTRPLLLGNYASLVHPTPGRKKKVGAPFRSTTFFFRHGRGIEQPLFTSCLWTEVHHLHPNPLTL
ncbi:hypothetical protein [Ktedonobacter sp. SOSP1-85]|uniref:hypothetical protein n=1 Tax=Ktedonobacter sp. SOSP1-85 TaxID=2778367 RepID=UPI0019159CFB|nr:hypothetical protein [Ktedonobacter sp. SOSP1-85]